MEPMFYDPRYLRCMTNAGLSFWEKDSFYAPQDIIIAGAGLMALWTALELMQRNPNLRVTLLERNTTPLGASTRNAGFACFGSPTELISDAASGGTDAMLELVEMRWKGIEKIRLHFADAVIGFEPCGGYECIKQDYRHWNLLDEKLQWLNGLLQQVTGDERIFSRCPERLAALGLRGFDTLLENRKEAALHSGKLVRALTQKVQDAGAAILYGMEISDWESGKDAVSIRTRQGITFTAGRLLLCTNAFTPTLSTYVPVKPARGQVIVTSPIHDLSLRGTFHFDEGFYYWRNLGNRILLGGARNMAFEDEETTDLSGSEKIRDALVRFLREHIAPSYQYTIDHHWSGIMGFTQDKAPFVGMIGDNIFSAIACNGIGVALTPVIAEKAADMLVTGA